MKKTISLILCIIMTVSLLSVTAFAQGGLSNFQKTLSYTEGKFTDVDSSDWFAMNVEAAYEYNLMNGRTAQVFGASDYVRISEVIALAARLRSIYMIGQTNFETTTPWYQSYVDYAVANEMITSNQFEDYEAYATRYQFAEILATALPSMALTAINSINIGDIPDVSFEGSYLSIYTLYRAGVITGKTAAGHFYPSEYILRSETAAIVTRMANEDLRIQFTIDKSSGNDLGKQLMATVEAARDEVLLALDCFNNAYSKATSSYYVSAASQLDKATTYTQMAAQYAKSAADSCEANSSYSGAYDGIYSSYLKCMEVIGGISSIASSSYSLSADWTSTRTLLNECSDALLIAYTTIKDVR